MIGRIVKKIYNPSIVWQLARLLLPSKFDKPNQKPLLFYDLKKLKKKPLKKLEPQFYFIIFIFTKFCTQIFLKKKCIGCK